MISGTEEAIYPHLSSVGRARDCNWTPQAYLGVACSNQAGEITFLYILTSMHPASTSAQAQCTTAFLPRNRFTAIEEIMPSSSQLSEVLQFEAPRRVQRLMVSRAPRSGLTFWQFSSLPIVRLVLHLIGCTRLSIALRSMCTSPSFDPRLGAA